MEEGTTAPEMMLLPYRRDPDTGSLIPSISTGGHAKKPTMYTTDARVNRGKVSSPNQPIYNLLEVVVTT